MTGNGDADGGHSDCDPDGETYRRRVDFRDTDPHEAVVDVASAVSGVEPTDLDPLYHALDPEALDDLVSSGGTAAGDLVVEFTFHDHRVRVHESGLIEVQLLADSDDRA